MIKELYETLININVPAMCSCYKPVWLHPSKIQLRRDKEYKELSGPAINVNKGDPYVTAAYNKTFDLGKDLLDNGTYWPYLINDRGKTGYFVREGNHRMAAIHILIEQGLWPKDRKVFCLVYSKNVYDPLYILEKPVYLLKVKLNDEGQPLKELVEHKCRTASEVKDIFNFSTPYFRNWIWFDKLDIKQHPLINKETNYWNSVDMHKEKLR